jgi:putative phosphoribosyl transferase
MFGEMRFKDRIEAGQALAQQLAHYADRDDTVVLALPRGGVPVAFEVARQLHTPLDVFIVRKLGVPGHPELAMGAIASGGGVVLNHDVMNVLKIPRDEFENVVRAEQAELQRREREYRGNRPPPNLRGRRVILIDDGLATGSSMRAAVAALRQRDPAKIIVAVPVASPETCAEFRNEVDEVVCALTPAQFYAVGYWYEDFTQTSDEEVHELLRRAEQFMPARSAAHVSS